VKPSNIDLKLFKKVIVGGWIGTSNKIENSNMLIN